MTRASRFRFVMSRVRGSSRSPWDRSTPASSSPGTSASRWRARRGNAEQRALRPELDLGIGGARPEAKTLKCLHAHVAFALARPGYELGERILAEVDPPWPEVCSGA